MYFLSNQKDNTYTSYSSDNYLYNFGLIRSIFYNNLYNNTNIISSLNSYIQNYIDCISIDFNPIQKVFVIKIKKTAMKKGKAKFENTSYYYYAILYNIFNDFLLQHKEEITRILDSYDNFLSSFLYNNINSSCLLCNILCAGNSFIYIYL